MQDIEGARRSLVVPMYQEAMRVQALVQALEGWRWLLPTEVILVDDGSDDGTAEIAEGLVSGLKDVRLLRLPTNRGKGAAVRQGVLSAAGGTIAFADADLSAGLDEVERCFAEAEVEGVDIVIGTRVAFGSCIRVHQPPWRQLSGKIFNVALRQLGLTQLGDTQCGLKGFRAPVARQLFEPLLTEGFAFDVELLVRAHRLGLHVRELPILWEHREASRVTPVRHGTQMLADAVRIRCRFGRQKGHACGAMTDQAFDAMAAIEREHWWFTAKRRIVMDALAAAGGSGALVDVGCGTGQAVAAFVDAGFKPVIGSDLSQYALTKATAAVPECSFMEADASRLPLAGGALGCVTSLDVIEHLEEPVDALREYGRAAAGGLVVCTVPAYMWAWSEHDVRLGHRRRYTRTTLRSDVELAGLEVLQCSYFHHWLVLAAVVMRKTPLRSLLRGQAEASSFVNPSVNRSLTALASLERWIGQRVDVPFGLSILVVARAPALA